MSEPQPLQVARYLHMVRQIPHGQPLSYIFTANGSKLGEYALFDGQVLSMDECTGYVKQLHTMKEVGGLVVQGGVLFWCLPFMSYVTNCNTRKHRPHRTQ